MIKEDKKDIVNEITYYILNAKKITGEEIDLLQNARMEIENLQKENEQLKDVLNRFINRSNKVTSCIRHGISNSQESINKLYAVQLKAEQIIKESKHSTIPKK